MVRRTKDWKTHIIPGSIPRGGRSNTASPTPLVQVLPVGSAPIHAAITTNGRFGLVGNGLEQTVSVVDLETRAVVDTVDLDSTSGPSDVAIQP